MTTGGTPRFAGLPTGDDLKEAARELLTRWRPARSSHMLADGVVRFTAPGIGPTPPFPGYEHQPGLGGPLVGDWRLKPKFGAVGRKNKRRYVARVSPGPGADFYATGEVAGPLRRNGRRIKLYNFDSYGYNDKTPALYQSHPWVLGLRSDGSAFGVLFETTWRAELDLRGDRIVCRSEGPIGGVTVIEKKHPQEVVERLSRMTGLMPMPPIWALGFQQSRYSYEPDGRVREIADQFRRRQIPCDVIWMDIDYMDGYRCFTFDNEKFPDPAALNKHLQDLGYRTVWMIDPGIKAEEGYGVYDEGKKGGHFLKLPDGSEARGEVWPGQCVFPDYTREETRRWWAGLYEKFIATGIDGVWNDMNEPSVFDAGPERTLPDETVHEADEELGGKGPHTRYHNIYGMQMVRATREGIANARPDRRPFVLTRANFIGGQRYAATWTGDNLSEWRHLRWSIPMALNLGLSAQPFAGPDIGGFGGEADGELFSRWMGIGALLPFCRAHSSKDTGAHEPWSFDEMCEKVCRAALERRMRLMPYLYTLFFEASRLGRPVVRPLFFADPHDLSLRDAEDAFLLGGSLLVQADVWEDDFAPSAPPRGIWRRFEPLGEIDPAITDRLPTIRVRGGAILPLAPVVQHTGELPGSTLTLIACPDENGRAEGDLFEDAGDGPADCSGPYRLSRITAERQGDAWRVRIEHKEGDYSAPERRVEAFVLVDDDHLERAELVGSDEG